MEFDIQEKTRVPGWYMGIARTYLSPHPVASKSIITNVEKEKMIRVCKVVLEISMPEDYYLCSSALKEVFGV